MLFSKRLKRYLINRELKQINKDLEKAQDIKSYLVVENKRLDLMMKLNKIGAKK